MAMARGHLVARVRRILEFGADRHPMKLPRSLLVLTGVVLIMPVGLVLSRAQQAGSKPAAETRTGRVEPADLVTQALALWKRSLPFVAPRAGQSIRSLRSRPHGPGWETELDQQRRLRKRSSALAPWLHRVFARTRFEKSLSVWPRPAKQKSRWSWPWSRRRMSRGSTLSSGLTCSARSPPSWPELGSLNSQAEAVERVSDPSARNDALAEIALAQARQSDLASALQSVDKINDSGMRVRALAGPLWDGTGIAWIRDSAGTRRGRAWL